MMSKKPADLYIQLFFSGFALIHASKIISNFEDRTTNQLKDRLVLDATFRSLKTMANMVNLFPGKIQKDQCGELITISSLTNIQKTCVL